MCVREKECEDVGVCGSECRMLVSRGRLRWPSVEQVLDYIRIYVKRERKERDSGRDGCVLLSVSWSM